MKTVLILAIFAIAFVFAEPEADPKADPYYLFGGYYGGLVGKNVHGYVHPTHGYAYPGYRYLTYGRKKREAEAEPKADADPYYLFGGYYGGLVGKNVHGYVHPTHGYATGLGAYPAYTLGSYLTYGRKKREADSEPKAEADPWLLYGGYYGLHYPGYYSYPAYTTYPAYTSSYVTYGRKKREAESDPALLYASAYAAFPRYSYGYSYPTYGYTYPYYRYGY